VKTRWLVAVMIGLLVSSGAYAGDPPECQDSKAEPEEGDEGLQVRHVAQRHHGFDRAPHALWLRSVAAACGYLAALRHFAGMNSSAWPLLPLRTCVTFFIMVSGSA
jgi:hypothetical protein